MGGAQCRCRNRWGQAVAVALLVGWSLGVPTAARGGGSVPELSGAWAQKVVTTAVSDAPFIGRVTSRTTAYLRVDVSQRSRSIAFDPETCRVSTTSDVSAVRLEYPAQFTEAFPDDERRGRIVSAAEGPRLQMPRRYAVLGARLREPTSEQLPGEPGDARVVDADGDGEPGVTVRVRGLVDGEIYIVQRAWDAYRAPIENERRIVGTVAWGQGQRVLDSTSIFLGSQPETRPHPDEEKSYFEMVRIPAGLDCAELLERRGELFER